MCRTPAARRAAIAWAPSTEAPTATSPAAVPVPAAMRLALPEANPSVYLAMSLAITFPFNLLVGIPLYHQVVKLLA